MIVETVEQLEEIYSGATPPAAKTVEQNELIPAYAKFIESSPFFLLATVGPTGLDCSARGDSPGFVRVVDSKTIMFPDRKGNNKIDSLRNMVQDPRVALLFLFPGTGTIFRLNGRASISTDQALRESFADPEVPATVIVITVDFVFMQCPRAITRSRLWDEASFIDQKSIPSVAQIVSYIKGRDQDEGPGQPPA